MDGLLQTLGAVLADVFGSAPVRLFALGFATYVTVVWLAAAHWVHRDMRRRRPDPATPYLAALGVVAASPVLLPVSIFTYLVLRPGETLAEARERQLMERLEALDAETGLACPGCALAVDADWLVCPGCRTRLAHRCRTCGRTMGLDWTLCGWCGTEFGRSVVPHRLPSTARRAVSADTARSEPRVRPANRPLERPAIHEPMGRPASPPLERPAFQG